MRPKRWVKWLGAEPKLDEADARLLSRGYWVVLVALSSFFALAFVSGWRQTSILLGASTIAAWIFLKLSHRGWPRAAGAATLFMLLGIVHLQMWWAGSLHEVTLIAYPAVITLGGLYLRSWMFVLLTGTAIASMASVTAAHRADVIVSSLTSESDWKEFLVMAVVTALLAVVVQVQASNLRTRMLALRTSGQALDQQQGRFRALIENISEVILVLNPDATVQYVSPSIVNVLGYDQTERTENSAFDLVHPDDVEEVKRRFAQTLQEPGKRVALVLRMRHKSGDWRTMSLNATNLVDDPNVAGVVMSYRDISERQNMVSALEAAGQRLKLAVEAADVGLWVWDVRNNKMIWQENLYEVHRSTSAGYVNFGFDLIHPEDIGSVRKWVRGLVEDGGLQRCQYRLADTDPGVRWIEVTARVERDGSGQPTQITGVSQNITNFKEAELDLRASEQRFAVAFNANPHPMSVSRIDDGTILNVNDSFLETFGYERDQVVGRTAADVGTWAEPEDRGRLLKVLAEQGKVRHEEVDFHVSDDSIRTFLIAMEPIRASETDCLLIASTDITERKEAERVLRESERKFFQIFQANPCAMAITNVEDGCFIDVNDSILAVTGWSKEEMIGKNATDLQTWSDPADRERFTTELTANGSVTAQETVLRRKDGSNLHLLLSAEVVSLGQRSCIFWSGIDVTVRRRLINQLQESQKMEALGRLAGGVAHDFNNWLTPIVGYCDLLLELDDDEDRRSKVRNIKNAGNRAAELASQLLRFSRGEMVQKTAISLNTVIAKAEVLFDRILGDQVELELVLDQAAPAVDADPTQLHQILLNLAINAGEALDGRGRVVIETSIANIPKEQPPPDLQLAPGLYVVLSVSDDGCGMDRQTTKKIFEPFFTTKDVGKGTGLGLATVYGIVKQHDGDIVVYSEPGRGTTFKAYLPCSKGLMPPSKPAEAATKLEGSETVLLVEDQDAVREFGEAGLRSFGYSVVSAKDAEEALRLITEEGLQFAILLTDVVLPKVGGFELAAKVQELRDVPVVFVSGYSGHPDTQGTPFPAGSPMLHKPYSAEDLARVVRGALA